MKIPNAVVEMGRKDIPLFILAATPKPEEVRVTPETSRWLAEHAMELPVVGRYSRIIDNACDHDTWWLGEDEPGDVFSVLRMGALRYVIKPSLWPGGAEGIPPEAFQNSVSKFATFARTWFGYRDYAREVTLELALCNVNGLVRKASPKYYSAREWTFGDDIRLTAEARTPGKIEAEVQKLFHQFLFKARLEKHEEPS